MNYQDVTYCIRCGEEIACGGQKQVVCDNITCDYYGLVQVGIRAMVSKKKPDENDIISKEMYELFTEWLRIVPLYLSLREKVDKLKELSRSVYEKAEEERKRLNVNYRHHPIVVICNEGYHSEIIKHIIRYRDIQIKARDGEKVLVKNNSAYHLYISQMRTLMCEYEERDGAINEPQRRIA